MSEKIKQSANWRREENRNPLYFLSMKSVSELLARKIPMRVKITSKFLISQFKTADC